MKLILLPIFFLLYNCYLSNTSSQWSHCNGNKHICLGKTYFCYCLPDSEGNVWPALNTSQNCPKYRYCSDFTIEPCPPNITSSTPENNKCNTTSDSEETKIVKGSENEFKSESSDTKEIESKSCSSSEQKHLDSSDEASDSSKAKDSSSSKKSSSSNKSKSPRKKNHRKKSSSSSSSSSESSSSKSDKDSVCPLSGKYLVKDDGGSYYDCKDGYIVKEVCPSGHLFDIKKKDCRPGNLVKDCATCKASIANNINMNIENTVKLK